VDDVDASQTAKLVNISTRALVQTGANVAIGGFIISGGVVFPDKEKYAPFHKLKTKCCHNPQQRRLS